MALTSYVKDNDWQGLRKILQRLNEKLDTNASPTWANVTISGTLDVPAITNVDYIGFDTTYADGVEEGRLQWNTDDGNLEVGMPGGDVNQQIGKDLLIRVRNKDVTDLAIGEVVYAYPTAIGGKNVQRSTASDATIASQTVGIVMEPITVNQFGYIALIGVVSGFDTSAFTYGQIAYLGTTPGTIVAARPTAPNAVVEVGIVVYPHHTEGVIYARIAAHPTLSGIGDVHISGIADGDLTQWSDTNSRWENSPLFDSMGEPTGFDLNTSASMGDISFTDGTRTFSIAPKSGEADFRFWDRGKEHVRTTQEDLIITDVEGVHVIYFNSGVLTDVVNPAGYVLSTIMREEPLVSILYWNATDSECIYFGEERHGMQMDGSTHSYLHYTAGLAYLSGLGLNTLDVDQNGSSNAHAQFGVDAGGVSDEDIYISSSAVTSTTGLPIYYMLGSTPRWVRYENAGYSVRTYDGTTATRLAYNEYTGGSWQLTEESGGDFVLYHVFATTNIDDPMICMMGQNGYSNKSSARSGALTEIHELILNDTMFPEIRPIATVIFQTKTSYTNDINARVVSTDEGDDYIDWRSESISRIAVSTSDHGTLSGLADDDHTQYHNDGRAATWLTANHETTYAHANIALNTTHRSSNGINHGYINQDVQSSASPTFVTATLTGVLNLPVTSATVGQIKQNSKRMFHTYAHSTADGYNLFLGEDAGNFTSTPSGGASTLASRNIGIGYAVLDALTTGYDNVGLGVGSLSALTTGHSNMAMGLYSLGNNTTGYENLAIGTGALATNVDGVRNVALGRDCLYDNVSGTDNTCLGRAALYACTGHGNLGIGKNAGDNITSGSYNIAIGIDVDIAQPTWANQLNIGNLIKGDMTAASRAVHLEGPCFIKETAAALGDKAGYGQLWVKNTTPCELWFTDDAGTDTQIV